MKNYYQKYEKNKKYLQEYFDDGKYDKDVKVYKNVYITFIKKYLPIFIKRFFPKKITDTKSLYINIESFYSKIVATKDLNSLEYDIVSDCFLVSQEDYHAFYNFATIFCETYGIKMSGCTLKQLIDAYYMELQRLENETLEKEYSVNLYQEFNNEIQINEDIMYTYAEEIFEDYFLNQLIPYIIELNLNSLSENSDWNNKQDDLSINIKPEYSNVHKDYYTLFIPKEYFVHFMSLVRKFLINYNLGTILDTSTKDGYKVKFNSLKSLVDAYYMENQRLEYIKSNSLNR